MHVLYIHQYFATPFGCTGTRSYEFARRWVANGHKVTMLTTTAQLTSKDLAQASGWFFKRLTIDGIDVCAINLSYSQQMKMITRCLSFIGFVVLSSFYLLFTKRPDIIYATSTPLTVGIPALVAKCFRRIPFVFEVRDQWPEIPIELGIIKNKILIKLLLWLEKTIYKNSSRIVALSPGQADGVRKVLTEEKPITVIPNSCDTDVFRPEIDGSAIRQRRGWGNKLVLLHFGAMGKANGLGFVVEVAEKLKSDTDIHFVLVGDGSEKETLIRRIEQLRLRNIEILDSIPKTQLAELVAACDVAMVIFANYPILEHNSANKFFDSLSEGKPVLLNYSGWQRDLLEENNAGYGCKQYDVDEFLEKVLYLNCHRQEALKMGIEARRVGVEKYDRQKLAMEALDIIEKVKLSL